MHKIGRKSLALGVALAATLLPFGVVGAASPHVVDPDSLSPALNPLYAPYDCWATGSGSTCQGEVAGAWGPEVMDGFDCGGQTIYAAGSERQHITRWHDADGNATKTILATEFIDVFSLDPELAEPTVTLRSRFTKHYDYPIPGDRDSRVMRQTGASLIAKASDGGVIAREAGWVEFEPGLEEEVIADLRGPKDVLDDVDGFIGRLCEALGA